MKSLMIAACLVAGFCFLSSTVVFGESKLTDKKTRITKDKHTQKRKTIRNPNKRALLVLPDLTISQVSIRKSGGYIYITPTIKNLTSAGCRNVDYKFTINNTIEQPYSGVRFEGNSEFTLNGLGFREREFDFDSCNIKIQITRGCRELNLSNNTKTVSLEGLGAAPRIIRF